MFWNKKEKDCLEDYVNCKECGAAILIEKAYRVIEDYYGSYTEKLHYCKTHNPKYDKIVYPAHSSLAKIRYYTLLETDKEGKPIK